MESIKIEDLKKGDYFTKLNSKKVFERGSFCRTNKKYECTDVEDISNFKYIKKGTLINLSEF
jgi:hypothetical protein